MNNQIMQEKKERLNTMEEQLREAGHKLDSLWMEARDATGQKRTDIHKRIAPLREKQRANRQELEALKKGVDIKPEPSLPVGTSDFFPDLVTPPIPK